MEPPPQKKPKKTTVLTPRAVGRCACRFCFPKGRPTATRQLPPGLQRLVQSIVVEKRKPDMAKSYGMALTFSKL